jgi:hypothetical protein
MTTIRSVIEPLVTIVPSIYLPALGPARNRIIGRASFGAATAGSRLGSALAPAG